MKKILSNSLLRYTVCCCMIVMVFSVLNRFAGNTNYFSVTAEETFFRMEGSGGNQATVAYKDIRAITLTDQIDFGEKCSGYESDSELSGIWKNDSWQEYELFVNPKIQQYIILSAVGRTIVLNYESEDSTQSLYEGLVKFFREKGLDGQIVFTDIRNA